MAKRVLLFLVTNALVVVMVGLIMNLVLPLLGIDPRSQIGFLAIFCGIFGMVGAFVSLLISRWIAKKTYGVRLVRPKRGGAEAQLHEMISKLTRSAGIPMPEVGIYDSPEPNAFATGPSKKRSLIAFSTGILRTMNERELKAVAAHEVSHIANGDMVTMTLLTGIANAFVMFFARIIATVIDSMLSDDEGGGLGYFAYIAIVFMLESVFMILASIPLAWFSRRREFRADRSAADLTTKQDMAAALARLGELSGVPTRRDAFSMAKISDTKKASLFATHPPLEKRIQALVG